jgi:hypothetical protein
MLKKNTNCLAADRRPRVAANVAVVAGWTNGRPHGRAVDGLLRALVVHGQWGADGTRVH